MTPLQAALEMRHVLVVVTWQNYDNGLTFYPTLILLEQGLGTMFVALSFSKLPNEILTHVSLISNPATHLICEA